MIIIWKSPGFAPHRAGAGNRAGLPVMHAGRADGGAQRCEATSSVPRQSRDYGGWIRGPRGRGSEVQRAKAAGGRSPRRPVRAPAGCGARGCTALGKGDRGTPKAVEAELTFRNIGGSRDLSGARQSSGAESRTQRGRGPPPGRHGRLGTRGGPTVAKLGRAKIHCSLAKAVHFSMNTEQ